MAFEFSIVTPQGLEIGDIRTPSSKKEITNMSIPVELDVRIKAILLASLFLFRQ